MVEFPSRFCCQRLCGRNSENPRRCRRRLSAAKICGAPIIAAASAWSFGVQAFVTQADFSAFSAPCVHRSVRGAQIGGRTNVVSGGKRWGSLQVTNVVAAAGSEPAVADGTGAAGSSQHELLGQRIRGDFIILDQLAQVLRDLHLSPLDGGRNLFGQNEDTYDGKPLVYLDNAATSQKPGVVLDALREYYERDNSNVHRGAHLLSIRATEAYEAARDKVGAFVNAETSREIVFTRGATEAINLVAQTWGLDNIKEGDEIVTTVMEHHSNMVPWQLLAERTGAVIKYAQIREDMSLDVEHLKSLITERTKLVTMATLPIKWSQELLDSLSKFPVHISNTLGCINPVTEVAEAAHAVGAKVLVDGCQSVPNMPVDVQTLGADWLVASGHKMCAPTGIGFLWGRMEVLKTMRPWQGGGEMIDQVFFTHTTFAEPPARFEAGTPAIAQAVGLGAACDYLSSLGMANVEAYEHELSAYLWKRLSEVEGLDLYGPPANERGDNRNPLVAFNSRDVHANDLSFFLDQEGVAVRAGHHCTQALHRQLGAAGSLRASLYIYNTKEDVDRFIEATLPGKWSQELLNSLSKFPALRSTLDFFKGMDGKNQG